MNSAPQPPTDPAQPSSPQPTPAPITAAAPSAAPAPASVTPAAAPPAAPARRRSPMRFVFRAVLFLFILAALALGGLWFYLNDIVKQAVERGGTYATGVETRIDRVALAMTGGQSQLDNFVIANPQGFSDPHFFRLGRAEVDLQIADLLKEQMEVQRISLRNIALSLEKKGETSNYNVILDHLKKLQGDKKDPQPKPQPDPQAKKDEPAAKGKGMLIREVDIQNVDVTVDLLPLGGKLSRTTVNIPKVQLKNVGGEDGVPVEELTGIVVQAILDAVVKKAGSEIPGAILGELNTQLAGLQDLSKMGLQVSGEVVSKVSQDVGKITNQLTGEANKMIKGLTGGQEGLVPGDVGKQLQGATQQATESINKSIGNLLGGDKPKPATPTPAPKPAEKPVDKPKPPATKPTETPKPPAPKPTEKPATKAPAPAKPTEKPTQKPAEKPASPPPAEKPKP